MKPNKTQKKVISKINEFIFDKVRIKSYDNFSPVEVMAVDLISGSGKTTMLKMVLDDLAESLELNKMLGVKSAIRVNLTSTVKSILGELALSNNHPLVHMEASTIYSRAGMIVDKYSNEMVYNVAAKRLLAKANSNTIPRPPGFPYNTLVVFIDEASMLSKNNFKMIVNYFAKSTSNFNNSAWFTNVKIILIGDTKQLLQVKNPYKFTKFVTGKKIVMDSNNTIRSDDKKFRKYIVKLRNYSGNTIAPIPQKVGNVLECVKTKKFTKLVLKTFKEHPGKTKYITFTNNSVLEANNYINSECFGSEEDVLEPGGTVTFNGIFRYPNGSKEKVMCNYKYKVIKAYDKNSRLFGKCKVLDIVLREKRGKEITTRVIIARNTSNIVKLIDSRNFDQNYGYESDGYNAIADLMEKANKLPRGDEKEAVMFIISNKQYVQPSAKIVTRHASTVHGEQGATSDYIFLDLNSDHLTAMDHNTFSRFLYVAISRARKKVYVNGNVPSKFLT